MDASRRAHIAFQSFGDVITIKMAQLTRGEPEEQLRSPFENLITSISEVLDLHLVSTGETLLENRIGKPDYAIHNNGLLVGYVELKAPGVGADHRRFRGHNRDQFDRFSVIPNLLYTDGNEWSLYRSGARIGRLVRISGDVCSDGNHAILVSDSNAILSLLRDYLAWEPIIPIDRRGRIDLRQFALLMAPVTRMLKNDVLDALHDPASPLVHLANDWRQLLFPEASDEQFADSYAQTVSFALLLGRSEGAEPLTLESAESALNSKHSLLARALKVLTDPAAQQEISASLGIILRIVAAVPYSSLGSPEDPWTYFYEDFLSVYDPELRRNIGAYYTPVQVVSCQVSLVEKLLVQRFGKSLGFADRDVITLDPAVGTGTYLLGVVSHALQGIEVLQGSGAVPGQASELANNLVGFEIMVGPYAVAELRISRLLSDYGAQIPTNGIRVYLTDTLESPHAVPPQLPLFLQPISEQHRFALEAKCNTRVIVCIGNPPYDRHEAANPHNRARTGGWIRWGDSPDGNDALFKTFTDPVINAGFGVHVKNLYNLYVYFWRWGLWKVFESNNSSGPGVISYITSSAYLEGKAFFAMRELMRRICDEIWIIDLGGDSRSARTSENVFAIQTPVAIAIAVRNDHPNPSSPARVNYSRVEGTRAEILGQLEAITSFDDLEWVNCPDEWTSPFKPSGQGEFFQWPAITDLMPWQHSGFQLKRTWPIAPSTDILERRWRGLLASTNRAAAFKATRDRRISTQYSASFGSSTRLPTIASLPPTQPMPNVARCLYRSFDRQYLIADNRLGDFFRPVLWQIYDNERQVYFSTMLARPLSAGPAMVASAYVPDMNSFRGSCGGADIFPVYRDPREQEFNLSPDLLQVAGSAYGVDSVTGEEMIGYIYCILSCPHYTSMFTVELESREVRVPLTKSLDIFRRASGIGKALLYLHTYGERMALTDQFMSQVEEGRARCITPVSSGQDLCPDSFSYDSSNCILRVGDGEFAPVTCDTWDYEVSGLKVLQSWLGRRMRRPSGKRSSPLDDLGPACWMPAYTTELLELLWLLENTIRIHDAQSVILAEVCSSECFTSNEFTEVPAALRRPPGETDQTGLQLNIC